MPAGWVQTTPLADVTLAAGQVVAGVQIGGWSPPTSTISGIVFNDTNGDGIQNGSETRAASKIVFIDLDGDNALEAGERAVITNSSGAWGFDNLAPGTYHIRRTAESGYTSSVIDVTVTGGQVLSGLAIATKPNIVAPVLGSLTGFAFNDNNKNGKFDSKDSKTGGKTIFLDTNNNGKLDSGEKSSVTDSSGNFSFTGLAAGTYRVRRVFPTGYTYSTALINFTLAAGQNATGLAIGSKTV
jgi:hypothetical protein